MHLGLDRLEQVVADGVAPRREVAEGPAPRPGLDPPRPHRAQVGVRREEDALVGLGVDAGHRLGEPVELVDAEQLAHGEQRRQVGVADDPAQLGRLVVRVEHRHDGADARGGQPRHHPVRAVRPEQPHAGALAGARREQALGQPGRPVLGLAVGQPIVAEDDEVALAPPPSALAHEGAARRREGREVRCRSPHGTMLPVRQGAATPRRRGDRGCRPSPWPCPPRPTPRARRRS